MFPCQAELCVSWRNSMSRNVAEHSDKQQKDKRMAIRIFMLGWEFPPFISGGLGTACYGLTKAMDRLGIRITFVLPTAKPLRFSGGLEPFPGAEGLQEQGGRELENVRFITITSALRPYTTWSQYERASGAKKQSALPEAAAKYAAEYVPAGGGGLYGGDMYAEVHRYADKAVGIAETEEFDIIHAHDWMTFPAGAAVARATGKPLIVHVHSTEFDRSGEHVNQMIYDIERQGMHTAWRVIAVSNYTRNLIISRYGVAAEKVEVVYNGVENGGSPRHSFAATLPARTDKIVLFLGRITMQKGPEYFLYAAKRVLEKIDNVKFIMAGAGDMLYRCIELAAQMGIGSKVLFTRFLRGDEVDRAYKMADLYVMPSVSEPFGITPLEALRNNVPVLISKQSGIAEKLRNALKVDFWDVDEMANKMVAVLKHDALGTTLRDEGTREVHKFRWEDSAARVNEIYGQSPGSLQASAK